MRKIYIAEDNTQFINKVDCVKHEFKLRKTLNIIKVCLDKGLLKTMKINKELSLVHDHTSIKDFKYTDGHVSFFRNHWRYGGSTILHFYLRKNKLVITNHDSDDCSTEIKYVGTINLDKL